MTTEMKTAPLLECINLSKRYGHTPALNTVNLRLEAGKITGLLGANGSGKTTLLKLASGLLTPTSGEILIHGKPPGVESKAVVSFLPDRTYLADWMRVRDVLDFFTDFYADFDQVKALEMLVRLGLNPDDRIRNLSKGNKEKVHIIIVMSRQADLYLLDEPIGGVDPAARDFILRTIIGNYSEGASVLLSTHLIYDVEKILDQVIFIGEGEIRLEAAVDDIREQHGMSVDELFREEFKC